MNTQREVRNIIESEMIQIKGMFIGGDCLFRIKLNDGTEFTNYDFFKNKRYYLEKLDTVFSIDAIEIDEKWSTEKLIESMNTSTSIIGISKDQKRDYQTRMIDNISKYEKQINSIQSTLKFISSLKPMERKFILITHGILNLKFEELVGPTKMKKDTIRRKYGDYLNVLSIYKGFNVSW